ncbi:gonadotropin-releasing hormone receptor [Caerostris extrusa]|uniref:Gonadotropin-releasing hormone receptor n=1 Tax=Caerostris extrusa TaxID=172846 RepID=A0AAV4Y813_CAEEX|nr:gonadotropin-releasing hormone receptor [Caerostris extrusa]
MLVAIALDRYNAIVRPLSSSLEPKYYALIAWFVASLPAMPCLIVFHVVQPSENVTKCVSQFYTSPQALFWRQAYVICILLVAFILPFTILFALYIRIMVEIHVRSSVFTANQQTASSLPRRGCLRSLMTIIRSSNGHQPAKGKDTSFVSGSSKTSSRFDVNALSTVPPTQAAKVAAIINGEKKIDETFV